MSLLILDVSGVRTQRKVADVASSLYLGIREFLPLSALRLISAGAGGGGSNERWSWGFLITLLFRIQCVESGGSRWGLDWWALRSWPVQLVLGGGQTLLVRMDGSCVGSLSLGMSNAGGGDSAVSTPSCAPVF